MSVVMNETSRLRANVAVAANSQEPEAAPVDAAKADFAIGAVLQVHGETWRSS
jgi:hypothetical protein